jgi:hypothetical protein
MPPVIDDGRQTSKDQSGTVVSDLKLKVDTRYNRSIIYSGPSRPTASNLAIVARRTRDNGFAIQPTGEFIQCRCSGQMDTSFIRFFNDEQGRFYSGLGKLHRALAALPHICSGLLVPLRVCRHSTSVRMYRVWGGFITHGRSNLRRGFSLAGQTREDIPQYSILHFCNPAILDCSNSRRITNQ